MSLSWIRILWAGSLSSCWIGVAEFSKFSFNACRIHAEHFLPSHDRVHYKGSHTRNQWGKGGCHSRTVVVGYSFLSEVPAMFCPCSGCTSAKKPKYFIIVWVPCFFCHTFTVKVNMKLFCRGKCSCGECSTISSLFQVIYLLHISHPLKFSYILDTSSPLHKAGRNI